MKYCILAIALIAVTTLSIGAQATERDTAIKHYRDGNDIEAILALEALLKKKEYASDAEAINYLGLAYQNALDEKGARKMFEKAVKLEPESAVYRANLAYSYLQVRQLDKSQSQAKKALEIDPSSVNAYYVMGTADLWEGKPNDAMVSADKMISINPGSPLGYMLKSDALIAILGSKVAAGSSVNAEIALLRGSVEVLEEGAAKNTETYPTAIGDKLEAIRAFLAYYTKDRSSVVPGVPLPPEPGVTPVKVLSKPRATYTNSARAAGVSGNVRLAVLLGANGKVIHILKLKGIGYGLDEQAQRAAQQIVFEPKTKDGVPVSTVVIVEYGFAIY